MYHSITANLQVLDAKRSEVAALWPEATVERWSDDYITVLDDSLDMASVSEAGKKLSVRLSRTVLSVALEDDKVLELIVWQKGKRQAVRAFRSDSGGRGKGDPRVFGQAWGLSEEDVKRLETVWDRGNAREQLELTGLLIGAPLNCSIQRKPLARVSRDVYWVDEWMRYLADRTKGRNQTKTSILQELSGLVLAEETDGNGWEGFLHLRPAEDDKDYDWTESVFCHPGPDGRLERLPKLDPRPEVIRSPHAACCYIPVGEGRILSLGRDETSEYSVVVEDSAGLLTCPLPLTSGGQGLGCQSAWGMTDGGILAWLDEPEGDGSQGRLVRYARDGALLWSRKPERPCRMQMFSDNLVWFSDEECFFSIGIEGKEDVRIALNPEPHIDRERGCGVKYNMLKQSLPGEVWILENTFSRDLTRKGCTILSYDLEGKPFYDAELSVGVNGTFCEVLVTEKQILLYQYDQGVWLLSPLDLSILAGSEDHRDYLEAAVDGAGRIWLFVADELEAYDRNLTILSRHHLRGSLLHQYLDQKGRLCVITYEVEKHIIRVYRLA